VSRTARPAASRPSAAPAVPVEDILDGRRRRGADNRNRISEAFLALIAEGVITPTADDVARRAGVGLRSVFRHFSDMEALYREMAAHSQRLAGDMSVPMEEGGDWQEQLDRIIDARASVYEEMMPYQVAAQVHQHESPFLRAHQTLFIEQQRSALLRSLPRELLREKAVLEAVNMALSMDTWTLLRREQGLNRAAAKRVIALTCRALLDASTGR
jgi:AcrR family transcriptional regulator